MENEVFYFSPYCDTTHDDKISQNNFTLVSLARNWWQDFSWHTYLDRWSISHTSPEDKFYLFEEGAFYHLNQQRVPKRAAKFEKGVLSEVRYLGFNMWPGEGWDGGISYNGECLVVWNKRNCDEMGKWILFSRQNQKEHSLINIWA